MSDIGLSPDVARAIVVTLVVILAGLFLAGFLAGSIPFGYLVGRIFYHTDIRKQGSGNIGAMNALRTMGTTGALVVLLLDALKGFVPTFLTFRLGTEIDPDILSMMASVVAFGAVAGHCFSPWLRFRGGKGVATAFGATFALSWPAGLVAVGGWAAGAALTRFSSVGSMLGSALMPFALWFFTRSLAETAYGALAALLILFKHRENIARLRAGQEGPIRLSKARSQ